MKAVVLEIRNGFAAALRDDGVVVKIRRKCSVGDVIEINEKEGSTSRGRYRFMRSAAAAAAALVLIGGGAGTYTYQTAFACSYVSLDINPSIDFVLNRMDKVISVDALNEDAEPVVEILEEEGVRGDSLEEALEKTQTILIENNYITEDELDYVLINVASDSDKRKEKLGKAANQVFGQNEESVQLVVTEGTTKEHEKAAEFGISSGRYSEIKAITGITGGDGKEPDESQVKEFRDFSVRDLMIRSGDIKMPKSQPQAGLQSQGRPEGQTGPQAGQEFQNRPEEQARQELQNGQEPQAGTVDEMTPPSGEGFMEGPVPPEGGEFAEGMPSPAGFGDRGVE